MPIIRAPPTKKTTTLTVVVKCRPLTARERGHDIVRVHNDQEVVVLDPDLSKDYLDRIQNRTKERRYTFDYAFGPNSTNLLSRQVLQIIFLNFLKLFNILCDLYNKNFMYTTMNKDIMIRMKTKAAGISSPVKSAAGGGGSEG
ncbi:P-loop containing nucleoside triphosphate hydrolase superfamily protein [Abeliophyllum distichum]|uniref:P-loop containing nucleoside triphosphate hydrolase superfamily protein n=1 Tax=Abeliophyllum distichum TaxID=126358 RepID=A0ABD1SFI3_9LAMI